MNIKILEELGMTKEIERLKNRRCPTCGKEIGQFRNDKSLKEFTISGMCQKCQDKVFGKD